MGQVGQLAFTSIPRLVGSIPTPCRNIEFGEFMASKKQTGSSTDININLGSPNSEPQWKFFLSRAKYTCYGGARGGGKSWALVAKSAGGALRYKGINILVLRREYSEMQNTLIDPMLKAFPSQVYTYNKSEHLLTFVNSSTIKFGNMPGYGAAVAGKYQGQSYDWLFIDEATQFLESEFRGLAAIVRGVNRIPKRIYLTCNPGGVGHNWVKRLFIDRKFKKGENPKDYVFIKATVDDNKDLMENNPDYVAQLELLPEDIRRAHRYGDWDALAGVFFEEFTEGVHTCPPFPIPANWARYRAFDYGLDMFACLWFAVDENGRCYVYREYNESGVIASDAARKQLELTLPSENIYFSIAPPDMWAKQRETGKTMAATFAENGVGLVKADNARVQGWAAVKELLKVQADGKPNLIVFNTCERLIECMKCLMHDEVNPNDVSKKPHEITHSPDALRYFCQTRTIPGFSGTAEEEKDLDYRDTMDYQYVVCGGVPTRSYINF